MNDIIKIVAIIAIAAVCITALIVDVFWGFLTVIAIAFVIKTIFD